AASVALAGCTSKSTAAPRADATALPVSAPAGPASARDVAFLTAAASDAQFEVDGGTLAKADAADQRIRQFGDRMVRDHGQEYQRLQALAKATGTALPTAPASEQRDILTIWSSLHGGAFDCSYAPTLF